MPPLVVLVNFLSGCASVGYAKSSQQVLTLVEQVMQEKGKTVLLSAGWWQSHFKIDTQPLLFELQHLYHMPLLFQVSQNYLVSIRTHFRGHSIVCVPFLKRLVHADVIPFVF